MKRFAIIFLVLLLTSAVAFAESWICPVCGRENDSNFCPNDAQPRPQEEIPDADTEMSKIAALRADIDSGLIPVLNEEPIFAGKLLVVDYSHGSNAETVLINRYDEQRDKALFPDERMACGYDDADTVVLIYTKNRTIGLGFGGSSASNSYIDVCADVVVPKTGYRYATKTLWTCMSLSFDMNMSRMTLTGTVKMRGLTEIVKVKEALGTMLNLSAEGGDEALYNEACALYDEGLYYSARATFRESGYGDWAERAAACVQPYPENGEAWRNYILPLSSLDLTIEVNQEENSVFFARIYWDGRAYTGLFIKGSGTATVSLPAGTYSIKAGTGDIWYGGREAFGRNGSYETMTFGEDGSETVTLEAGYAYTLRINVEDIIDDGTDVGNKAETWDGFAE